jgi:hypothetical protein
VIYVWLNLLPILAATAAGFALSLMWLRLAGRLPARLPALLLFAAQLWLCAILAGALILAPEEAPRAVMVAATPVVIWAGFVLPSLFATLVLRGAGPGAALGESLLWLAASLMQALVLAAWGLVPPPR